VYQKTTFLGYVLYLAAAVLRARVSMLAAAAAPNPARQQQVPARNRRQIHEGHPGPIATMSRSKKSACNLVPGLPDPDLSIRVRAAAQQPRSEGRPVVGRGAVNRLDPESRVRAGVERVRLVRSAASLELASRWPKRAQDRGGGRPAARGAWLW
jgi:hypothetical protein